MTSPRILLVTSSARGHAIAETLVRSPQTPEIFSVCTTKNPGIRRLAVAQEVLDIMDFPAILKHARRWLPDFAIIGPDDPIGGGLADILEEEGIPCVAPTKNFARIESSKGFTRNLLQKYGMDVSPKFRVFTAADSSLIQRYLEEDLRSSFVVKYDGLRGGKGVKVSGEHLHGIAEGVQYALECLRQCPQVVIEEKITGVEFSLMSFVSGTQVVHMPVVQDHKRAFLGDTGPNTGGMGTISDTDHSLPFLTSSDFERAKEINQLVAEALFREFPLLRPLSHQPSPRLWPASCGRRGGYCGILYGGYMATANSIRVIEFNARLGDPEALNVLPILESDFVAICQAILSGELTENLVHFASKATVCKYLTPLSYPTAKNEQGKIFSLPPLSKNIRVFFGDVSEKDDGTLCLGGSRAVGVVGIANTLSEAEECVQSFCEGVTGPVRFRRDIGTSSLIAHRRETLHSLRESCCPA